jgi:hypothetical protein
MEHNYLYTLDQRNILLYQGRLTKHTTSGDQPDQLCQPSQSVTSHPHVTDTEFLARSFFFQHFENDILDSIVSISLWCCSSDVISPPSGMSSRFLS